MLKIQLDYFKFNSDIDRIIQKCSKTRYRYIELLDSGGARFSKQVAHEFALQLKADYLSGAFESSVPALRPKYEEWKDMMYPGQSIGELTGEMIGSIRAWRSRIGGDKTKRGYTVGIDQTKNSWALRKMNWLELGTDIKGAKGGPQPPRPIFALSLNRYVGTNFGRHVVNATKIISEVWD